MGRHGLRYFLEQREGWQPSYGILWRRQHRHVRGSSARRLSSSELAESDGEVRGPLYDGFIIFLGPSIIAATDAAIIAAHDDGRRSCKKKPRCGGEAARRPGPDRGR
jgi:hypothetical protein